MDDVFDGGASLEPGFHIGRHKHRRWSRECHSPPYVIKKHFCEAPITQGAETLGETRRAIRWLVRTIRSWKPWRSVGIGQKLGVPKSLRSPGRLEHEIIWREGDGFIGRFVVIEMVVIVL